MLDLHKGAKEYERFHLQDGMPVAEVSKTWLHKIVRWSNLKLPDGSKGSFVSWWVIGNALHWYKGDCKCDGTRTRMYWAGQLDDGRGEVYVPDMNKYVMCTTEKEKLSVRMFVRPGEVSWDNMGGA